MIKILYFIFWWVDVVKFKRYGNLSISKIWKNFIYIFKYNKVIRVNKK